MFWLNEECPKLLSSLGIDHRRRKTFPLWNSSGKNWVLQGITVCLVSTISGTVWCPGRFQTVSRGQVLVFFYRPKCIAWKRRREDRSLRASRDGHSSSSSISLTLLVFRHLLQVQRAAVLWTFPTWLIWSFEFRPNQSCVCNFLRTLRTDPYGPQEMATQARQASRWHYLCFAISCRSSGLLSSELSLPG